MPVWRSLTVGTKKVSPATIPNTAFIADIANFNVTYNKISKKIGFYGEIRSKKRHVVYNVIVMFTNILSTQGLTPEEIEAEYKPKPSISRDHILLRCSCPSYRFRFDKANRDHFCSAGKSFPIYHRKTNRKPNNPRNLAGYCSHLNYFVSVLLKQGFVTR